jgi:enediyne biosynthesis protein E4
MPIRFQKRLHTKLILALFQHALLISFLLSLTLASGCFKPAPDPPTSINSGKGNGGATSQIAFREVNNPILSSVYFSNGADAGMNSILEIVGGGVSCFDFDLDGNCDLLFSGGGVIDQAKKTVGGQASYFLRNRGEWRFEDCTAPSSLDTSTMYTHGVAIADYNNDGFEDALFYGYRGILLFHNQGDGTFLKVDLNLPTISFPWLTAAAWFDLENDGDLDLHLVSYVNWDFETHFVCSSASGKADVCSPTSFQGRIDLTLANQNNWKEKTTDEGWVWWRQEWKPICLRACMLQTIFHPISSMCMKTKTKWWNGG